MDPKVKWETQMQKKMDEKRRRTDGWRNSGSKAKMVFLNMGRGNGRSKRRGILHYWNGIFVS